MTEMDYVIEGRLDILAGEGETISAGPGEVIHIPKGSGSSSPSGIGRDFYFVYPADWQSKKGRCRACSAAPPFYWSR